MIYITGDTHGDFSRFIPFINRFHPTGEDVMIILGDAGINYYGGRKDKTIKELANSFPFTTFCPGWNGICRRGISQYSLC